MGGPIRMRHVDLREPATCTRGPVRPFVCLSFCFHFTAVYDKVSKSVADVGRSTQFAVNKL